jgi:hypothetical protein
MKNDRAASDEKSLAMKYAACPPMAMNGVPIRSKVISVSSFSLKCPNQ